MTICTLRSISHVREEKKVAKRVHCAEPIPLIKVAEQEPATLFFFSESQRWWNVARKVESLQTQV